MKHALIKFVHNERAATAVEYGLIIALIVIAIVTAISTTGGGTKMLWTNMSTKVGNALPSA